VAIVESENLILKAKAESEAIRIKTDTQANSIEILAKANAEALRLNAKGMKDSGAILSENETARSLQLIKESGSSFFNNKTVYFFGTTPQDLPKTFANPNFMSLEKTKESKEENK